MPRTTTLEDSDQGRPRHGVALEPLVRHLADGVTVALGDCMDCLPVECDAVITDPPYGITSNTWDSAPNLADLFSRLHLGCSGAVCMTCAQPFTSAAVMANLRNWKHEWIWKKNRGSNFANTVREPFKEHETVQVFASGKWTYNAQREFRKGAGADRAKYDCTFGGRSSNYREFEARPGNTLTEDRVPSSVQQFNTETGLHPTQKPVALMLYLVMTYSNEGDLIIDPYMGSGSTGVACIRSGRRFFGIELDRQYFETACERLTNELRQGRLF